MGECMDFAAQVVKLIESCLHLQLSWWCNSQFHIIS